MKKELTMNGLREILAKKSLMPLSEIHESSDLFLDLDLDSLCFLEVLSAVEREYGIPANPANFPQARFNTPEKLLAALAKPRA